MIRHVLYASRKVKRVAYFTSCRPILELEYASEVWGPYLARNITSLESIQRRAIRFISGITRNQSVSEARVLLDIDLLESRKKQARMLIMQKFCLTMATSLALTK